MRGPWRPAWIEQARVLWALGLTAPQILMRLHEKFPGFDKSEGSFSNLRNRRVATFPRRSDAVRTANSNKNRRRGK